MTPHHASIGSTIDWGNAPSWAAFGTAVIAATLGWGAYRREKRRDRIADQARVREQASKFAGWIESDASETRLYLRNASDLPIVNVTAWFYQMDWLTETTLKEATRNPTYISSFDVVAPGATLELNDLRFKVAQEISLTFTDAQGVLWARHKGSLDPYQPPGQRQPRWFEAIKWETLTFSTGLASTLKSFLRGFQGAIREMARGVLTKKQDET